MWRGWWGGTKNRKVFWSCPKVYTQTGTCSCLPKTFYFFYFFFTFLGTCVRENKFCFQGQLHGAYLQIKSQLCEHFFQSQESPIPGRLAFYVSALIFRKGLCIRLKHNLLYVLPVIKMFHLRLHKWLIPLCSMASVSGKKILWNSMATVPTCWRFQLKDKIYFGV